MKFSHIHIYFPCLLIFAVSVTPDTVPEFQFPCYVDVCTFPRQYCNSDRNERRCSPCTRSLCKIEDLPRACLYYCQEADKAVVTTASPKAQTEIESKWQDKSDLYLVYMVIFIAVTNTINVVTTLFISVWLLRFCGKKAKPPLSPTERFLNGTDEEIPLMIEGRKSHRQTEVELKRLESEAESSQTLPSYSSNGAQFVCIPHDSSKDMTIAEPVLDGHRNSLNNSESNSSVRSPGTEQNFVTNTFVSSPTNDEKHELHEKPWQLMDKNGSFKAELEETGLKQECSTRVDKI